jgi:hypothetical protein
MEKYPCLVNSSRIYATPHSYIIYEFVLVETIHLGLPYNFITSKSNYALIKLSIWERLLTILSTKLKLVLSP